MAGSSRRSLDLTDRLSRLEEGVREIALEIVQGIFAAELARIQAELSLGSTVVASRRRRERTKENSAAAAKAGAGKPNASQRVGGRLHAARDQLPAAKSAATATRSRSAGPTAFGTRGTSAAGGPFPMPVRGPVSPVAVEPTRTPTAEAAARTLIDDVTPVQVSTPSSADVRAVAPSTGPAAVPAEPLPERVVDEDRDPVAASSSIGEAGTVKWFSSEKAYGFIAGDDGTDVFVHQSAITAGGLRLLTPGQRVSYEEKRGPKGPFAAVVRPAPR
jgi:CspA family cold shock protein